jgi:hypothetical protein
MWRWTLRILAGLLSLIVLAALAGATYQWFATRRDLASTPAPGHLVDVGGHRLHLWCTGAGTPAVILDAGLGGSSPGWGFVQPDVGRFTRVCSYDRAGMGYRDPGPSPRTARRIANELAELGVARVIWKPCTINSAVIRDICSPESANCDHTWIVLNRSPFTFSQYRAAISPEADAKTHGELANQPVRQNRGFRGRLAHSRDGTEALRGLAKLHQDLAKEHAAK